MEDKKKNQVGAAFSNNSAAGDNDAGLKKRIALFRILQVLKKHSSKEKPLIQEDIVGWLGADHSFELERKAVGRGLRDLMDAGFNIKTSPRKGYYIDEGISDIVKEYGDEPFPGFDFYDNELFFLLSCISGSPDISDEKANELGNKIANLGNKAFRKAAGKRFIRKGADGQNDFHTASEYLKTLNAAIEALKEVRFKYHSYKLNKKNFSRYEIICDKDLYDDIRLCPMDLVFAGGKSFLIGKKPESSDLEVYRLDRMSNLVTLNNFFPCATTEEKDALADFKNKHPFMQGGIEERITIKVSPEILSEVADSFGSEISFGGKAGSFIHLSVKASEEEMISWALKNAGKAEVMEPYELRNKIRDMIDEAQKKYVRLDRIIPRERDSNIRSYISRFVKRDQAVDNNQHQLDGMDYRVVFLENNNLRNVSFLQFYDSLRDLTIINNPVSSILLRSCRLRRLELSKTGVERITFERNLSDLEDLVLFDNPIIDYSFLYNLRNLKRFMIDKKSAEKIDIEKIKRLNPGIEVFVEEKHWRDRLKILTIPDPYGNNKWLTEEELREKVASKERLSCFVNSLYKEEADLFMKENTEIKKRNRSLERHPLKTLTLGSYPQNHANETEKDPIEWIVLKETDDSLLLISKKSLATRGLFEEPANQPLTWEHSDLRQWLNTDFYNKAFSKKEKSLILEQNLVTENVNGEGVKELSKTLDKVCLLSKREFEMFRHCYDVSLSELTPRAEANCPCIFIFESYSTCLPLYSDWWLRTSENGNFYTGDAWYHDADILPASEIHLGARPVIQIKKTANIMSKLKDVKPSKELTPQNFNYDDYLERGYRRAKALYEMGAFRQAQEYFRRLDYKDSDALFQKARESRMINLYSEALEAIGNEDYELGYNILQRLGYDAVIVDNKYQRALKLIEKGDNASAARLLFNLNFKDSTRLFIAAEQDALKTATPSETVIFGSYPLENVSEIANERRPLEWKVLAKEGRKMLLEAAEYFKAGTVGKDAVQKEPWKNNDLRKWLNDTFIDEAFLYFEQKIMDKTRISTKGDDGEDVTLDRVFLLSNHDEKDSSITEPDKGCAVKITDCGEFCCDVKTEDDESVFVRPALWIEV